MDTEDYVWLKTLSTHNFGLHKPQDEIMNLLKRLFVTTQEQYLQKYNIFCTLEMMSGQNEWKWHLQHWRKRSRVVIAFQMLYITGYNTFFGSEDVRHYSFVSKPSSWCEFTLLSFKQILQFYNYKFNHFLKTIWYLVWNIHIRRDFYLNITEDRIMDTFHIFFFP